MPKIIKNSITYGSSSPMVELTQAEYNALSSAQKNNGTIYLITDSEPDAFNLNNMDDVNISSPSSGQVLSYDGGKWKNKNAEYKVGDTVNISGIFSGFLTSSQKEITFSIPFNKPINSSVTGITFSGGWTIRSVGGTYLANNVDLSSLGTINIFSFSSVGVVVQVVASTAFSETNNTPLAVQARTNVTATFTNS